MGWLMYPSLCIVCVLYSVSCHREGAYTEELNCAEIPDEVKLETLDEFLSTFDDYERHALKARNGICEEITQAWLEQAKKGA